MNHKTDTFNRNSKLKSQNQSLDSYFSDYFMSKNNLVKEDKKISKASFVVEWQMNNDKHDF